MSKTQYDDNAPPIMIKEKKKELTPPPRCHPDLIFALLRAVKQLTTVVEPPI